jgi:N-acetyl-S-(2-succino)cysteine monooxygenase
LPGGFDDFVNLVVPELQRRGLFRTGYTGHQLRHHLGLQRPVSRYVRPNGSPAPDVAAAKIETT